MALKYLYGASVQGIQGFIFNTNKLKEIIGASNLVEKICTTMFAPYVENARNAKLVIGAAGNIKCIFQQKEDCRRAVLEFKRKVMTEAPGITLSQAVVEYDDSTDFTDVIEELEIKLRTQRNKNTVPTLLGAIGIKRSARTGLPVIADRQEGQTDESTLHKLNILKGKLELERKFFGPDFDISRLSYDIEDIVGKNNWIAVIHADGNSLGQVVMKLGAKEDEFSLFSERLNTATIEAASEAFDLLNTCPFDVFPVRPVVLGGDDLTIICRADLAVPFCRNFLSLFKQKTGHLLGDMLKVNNVFDDNAGYLSACAGIAFVKSSYPFHYAYDLAESLCGEAKRIAKKNRKSSSPVPSCLMFHKVQDSFIRNYEDITGRELLTKEGACWKFGPYFLPGEEMEGYWTIDELAGHSRRMEECQETGLKSSIREWIGAMHHSSEEASQLLNRARTIIGERSPEALELLDNLSASQRRRLDNNDVDTYPAYDALTLYTINNQETNRQKQ